jgi:hypothetical protein
VGICVRRFSPRCLFSFVARNQGFRQGVGSAEESQQIYDELEKIDKHMEKMHQTLNDAKKFWEGVNRDLKSVPSASTYSRAKKPPDGMTPGPSVRVPARDVDPILVFNSFQVQELGIERRAEKIHIGLQTVLVAAQQYSHSRGIVKAGKDLVKHASGLTQGSTTILHAQNSVEIQLQSPACDPKSGQKAVSPLIKGLTAFIKGYEKLSSRFAKYQRLIYLLFWFAGTIAAENLTGILLYLAGSNHANISKAVPGKIDDVALANLISKRLSPYLLPFESAFIGITKQLRVVEKRWFELVSLEDAHWTFKI